MIRNYASHHSKVSNSISPLVLHLLHLTPQQGEYLYITPGATPPTPHTTARWVTLYHPCCYTSYTSHTNPGATPPTPHITARWVTLYHPWCYTSYTSHHSKVSISISPLVLHLLHLTPQQGEYLYINPGATPHTPTLVLHLLHRRRTRYHCASDPSYPWLVCFRRTSCWRTVSPNGRTWAGTRSSYRKPPRTSSAASGSPPWYVNHTKQISLRGYGLKILNQINDVKMKNLHVYHIKAAKNVIFDQKFLSVLSTGSFWHLNINFLLWPN